MSSEPIELGHEERNAARAAFHNATSDGFGYGSGSAVDEIIAAINKVRSGDPVGTVRRSVAGAIAVHIGGLEPDAWRTTYTDGETKWTSTPKDWAVIYTPEEES